MADADHIAFMQRALSRYRNIIEQRAIAAADIFECVPGASKADNCVEIGYQRVVR